jgi:hypothetical protein
MSLHTFDQCPNPHGCAVHARIDPPQIPNEVKPYVAAYLRWLGNDEASHGGTHCRFDRDWLNGHAEDLEAL